MSEKIKITVVTNNENPNTDSAQQNGDTVIVTHDSSMTIMSTLLKNNLISGSFCGGRGNCGRCRIRIIKGVIQPTNLEKSFLQPEELERGYRLACAARPQDDCVIRIAVEDVQDIDNVSHIVSHMIGVTENNDYISQQNNTIINRESDVTKYSGSTAAETMIAVDLGTTTIAMQLMAADTGEVIDTYCEMNPQRSYGADVLSRIQASCEGSGARLQTLVMEALERGVARFAGSQQGRIVCMCIAGNTAMEHLLMGYDVSTLGRSPFVPVETGLQEYRHPAWDFPVWLVPVISAFVGGDIVAGLYACGMLPADLSAEDGRVTGQPVRGADILIDLGTNGEMAISDGVRMIVTATAAGPAFEGGAGAGIVGSDMIACTAELLRRGVLDETGLLEEPYFTDGVSVGEPAVHLANSDIRGLQMAKSAVRAGIEILWEKMGRPEVENVYLAGGFGYYLDVEAAYRIGLFPEHMKGHVQAAGNTSLAGAYRIGRALYRHRIDRAVFERQLAPIETVNLAEQKEFEKLYIKNMFFPPK